MKVWFAVIGFVVGGAVGVAAGLSLDSPGGAGSEEPEAALAVPGACLDAISAARDRLLLNPDVAETLRDYRALGETIADDVSDLRVPHLRQTLGRLNDLNERSGDLIDLSVNARFSSAASDCERIAAERGQSAPE